MSCPVLHQAPYKQWCQDQHEQHRPPYVSFADNILILQAVKSIYSVRQCYEHGCHYTRGYSLEQYLCQMCEGYPHYQNIHEEHIHSKIPGGMPS